MSANLSPREIYFSLEETKPAQRMRAQNIARADPAGIGGAVAPVLLMTATLRLLYIDDEPLMCRALVRALKRQPVSVLTASSGKEGLNIARREPIDMLITDYLLHDLTGIDVATQVRVLHPEASIVLVSGFFDWARREPELESAGIEYFLPKPWENVQLENIIRSVLKRKQQA